MTDAANADTLDKGAPPAHASLAVPQEADLRAAIQCAARDLADLACRCRPMDRGRLETLAREVLDRLGLEPRYLGYAMVAVGTAWWRERFTATPFERRLLLLPHCVHRSDTCTGQYDADGLTCGRCGACAIGRLQAEAEALGYRVLVAEGTPAVVRLMGDALLGVACLDSLDKCFETVTRTGLPYAGVPLLRNGCVETEIDEDAVRALMLERTADLDAAADGPAALLAEAARLFEPGNLRGILRSYLARRDDRDDDPVARTEAIALEWLSRGGKRFRPFITLAAHAAMTRDCESDPAPEVADGLRAVAVAMEIFHKASLVHDDVEDNDPTRYGHPTVHALHGVPTAVNAGDYLIGLGYRLLAGQAGRLGAECVTDILATTSEAHLRLSRGQGAELLLSGGRAGGAGPGDVLTIYALKTAPAFQAAMLAGMRIAGPLGPQRDAVARFVRHMGVAYQVLDDLSDLRRSGRGDQPIGQDVLSDRPTVLRAFAVEAGAGDDLARILAARDGAGEQATIDAVRELYERLGVLEKARRLVEKCRARALQAADEIHPSALRDLALLLLDKVAGA